MTNQEQRPWRGDAKAVDGDTLSSDFTAASPPSQGPEAAGSVPESLIDILRRLADALDRQAAPPRLAYRLGEIASMVGVSRRLLEQARAAGRLPRPDLRIGRVSLWKVETVHAWLSQQADRQGGRSRS